MDYCDGCRSIVDDSIEFKERSTFYRTKYVEQGKVIAENVALKKRMKKLEKQLQQARIDRERLLLAEAQLKTLQKQTPYNEHIIKTLRDLNKILTAESQAAKKMYAIAREELINAHHVIVKLDGECKEKHELLKKHYEDLGEYDKKPRLKLFCEMI